MVLTNFLVTCAIACLAYSVGAACPTVVTRSEWGAAKPTKVTSMKRPVPYVIIHHSFEPKICTTLAACKGAMKSMQNYHQNVKKWSDIGYSFAIGGDGKVYEGRGWEAVGTHAPNYNSRSIGIVFIGDFTSSDPKESMEKAAKELIECGVSKGHISGNYKLVGHRQTKATACPGDKLYEKIKKWANYAVRP